MDRDTDIGGRRDRFPSTRASLLEAVGAGPDAEALDRIIGLYWKPVYRFLRLKFGKDNEDAKDLTQAFFLQLLEGEALRRYSPEKAGFRPYLKMLLRGFAANQHDAMNALKRGGGVRIVGLQQGEAPLADFVPDGQAVKPEDVFDRSWKQEILERAMERARQWFEEAGRSLQFRAFEEYELGPSCEPPTYAEVARRLGLRESDVRNYLFAVRERLRIEIRAELSQTVLDPQQLEEEWNELFGA